MNNFNQPFSERQMKNAMQAFLKIKSEILDYKNKIIREEFALIERIRKYNIETLKVLESLDKIISQIFSWTQIDQIQFNKRLGTLWNLPNIDFSQIKNLFLPNFRENIIDFSMYFLSSVKYFSLEEKLFPWSQPNIQEEIKKFKSYSLNFITKRSTIATFDAKRVKLSYSKLLSSQTINHRAAQCLLPDRNLFLHSKNQCMILYPFNYLKSMPAYKSSFLDACAIYIDGFVYLFGGLSAKLNINDERWSPLPVVPFEFGKYSTCAQFRNYILLSSRKSTKIFYYDILTDSYSEIPLSGLKKSFKLIFVKNDKAFLLEFCHFIYESDESLMVWNKVGKRMEISKCIPFSNHSIEYKEKFYFANEYEEVYSFDFKEKCIEYNKKNGIN